MEISGGEFQDSQTIIAGLMCLKTWWGGSLGDFCIVIWWYWI